VDFFSIGTNDLTQYTFAAERGNASVAHLADPLHPALLGMIRRVVEAAHAYDRPVTVCGEMAGDPSAVPILVRLGVDELSMNAPGIPSIKALVRGLHTEKDH
jgi:phosphoenolpyruvate-protein kinase (PTS system EI component)